MRKPSCAVGEDADAELEQRGVREPAMLRDMTLTLFSQRREIVHDVAAPQAIELARTLNALQSRA